MSIWPLAPGDTMLTVGPSTVKVLVIVFGILAILGCLTCGGLIGYGVYLSQPTWTPYASPDGLRSMPENNA